MIKYTVWLNWYTSR